MANVKINNKELVNSVKKASVSAKDTYVVRITNRKMPNTDKVLASISACDGTVQSNITFLCESDLAEGGQLIFGKEFLGIVQTLSQYDSTQDIELNLGEGSVKISCGKAEVSAGLLGDAVTIESENPKAEGNICITMSAAAFSKAVTLGGMGATTSVEREGIKNALSVSFIKEEETYKMRLSSTDGCVCAGAVADIESVQGEGLEERLYTLNATVVRKIADTLEADNKIQLFFFEKQVILRENNDFYIIVPNAAPFPKGIVDVIYAEKEISFKTKLNTKKLASAVDIAMLGATSAAEARMTVYELSGNGFTVSSLSGKNGTQLDAVDAEGAVKVGLNGSYVKNVISHLGEEVTISGTTAVQPVTITDGSPFVAIVAPFNLDTATAEE